jgi:hypothetical protein
MPGWLGIVARVFALTFVGTLLSFAVSLLVAILTTVVLAEVRGVHPDMRIAYRYVALPVAVVAALTLLVIAGRSEIRHYRQAKTLKAIERMS